MKYRSLKIHRISAVICSIVAAAVFGFLIVWAGDLNPSGGPADTMKTLDDIYYRLDKAAQATTSWGLDSLDAPDSTMYTLQQIYDMTPEFHTNPGSATSGAVCNSKTFYSDSSTKITGNRTDCATDTITWKKEGAGSWSGINEDLDWVKQVGITGWWSTTEEYSYCETATCTNTGATTTIPYTYGTPGAWNGSANYTVFDNSALQNYEVATTTINLGDCTADEGDLIFPDGSVWDKSATNAYSQKLTGCDTNDSNAAAIWSAAGGSGWQYASSTNAPSAISIADAWDGRKNLTSGENNTHSYTNDYTNNDYYDRPSQSWYQDTGDGVGTSRLPMIEEYEVARQGSWEVNEASLLNGTSDLDSFHWSAEQYPADVCSARRFYPSYGYADYYYVNSQNNRLWVVVAQ